MYSDIQEENVKVDSEQNAAPKGADSDGEDSKEPNESGIHSNSDEESLFPDTKVAVDHLVKNV